jgi:hypothetical protein
MTHPNYGEYGLHEASFSFFELMLTLKGEDVDGWHSQKDVPE